MKLSAAIDQYLHHLRVERGLAENTLLAYESDLRACWNYLTEGGKESLKLDEIVALHVKDFIAHIRDDQGFKPRSLSRVMSSLRRFFDYTVRCGLIEASPALTLHNPKIPKKLPVYLVEEEMTRLLRAPDRSDSEGYRDYAILTLFLFTGLRLSELVGLNIGDVDFEAGSILVHGKGSKERLIPLHRHAREVLATYLRSVRLVTPNMNPMPIFLGRDDQRMTARAVGWAVERAVKQAGVSHQITPHKLRHTFATQLLHRGANLLEIKELLGHSQLATTSIYTHTNVQRLKSAVEKIKV